MSRIPFLQGARDIIENHHERWDGAGYPAGKREDAIPLSARIFSVCDAYDAITSKRCYKDAISHEWAVQEIRRCAGTQFDPKVVEAFERIVESFRMAGAAETPDVAAYVDERTPFPRQPVYRNGVA